MYNLNKFDITSLLILGVVIGMIISSFYYYDFIENRNIDKLPFEMNNKVYVVYEYKPLSTQSLFNPPTSNYNYTMDVLP